MEDLLKIVRSSRVQVGMKESSKKSMVESYHAAENLGAHGVMVGESME